MKKVKIKSGGLKHLKKRYKQKEKNDHKEEPEDEYRVLKCIVIQSG